MSTHQSPASAVRPNYLGSAASPSSLPAFSGDMRATVLKHLSAAVAEKKVLTVMQILQRDPTMALEQIAVKAASGHETQQDVALACLHNNITAGYVVAVSQGYDATKLLRPALAKMATDPAAAEAAVGTLLAMGANPSAQAPTVDEPGLFAHAMGLAYHSGGPAHPGLISMLLDAKVSPVYPEAHTCPISCIILASGWDDPAARREHVLMMARLVKAGAPIDLESGSLRRTPLVLALGKKNGHALIALVQLGCSVQPADLPGKKDLYALMEANKLDEFKPAVQEALMARQIAKAKKEAAAASPAAEAGGDVQRTRRRLGAI